MCWHLKVFFSSLAVSSSKKILAIINALDRPGSFDGLVLFSLSLSLQTGIFTINRHFLENGVVTGLRTINLKVYSLNKLLSYYEYETECFCLFWYLYVQMEDKSYDFVCCRVSCVVYRSSNCFSVSTPYFFSISKLIRCVKRATEWLFLLWTMFLSVSFQKVTCFGTYLSKCSKLQHCNAVGEQK